MRWILFITMAIVVPLPWFLLLLGGIVPLIAMLLNIFCCLRGFEWDLCIIIVGNLIHLAVWGAVLFGLSTVAARLVKKLPRVWQVLTIVVIVFGLGGLAFLPLYSVGDVGGGYTGAVNLCQLLESRALW
jgi:hypothetical protein